MLRESVRVAASIFRPIIQRFWYLGSDAGGKRSDGEKKVIAVSGDSVELPPRHVLDFFPLDFFSCLLPLPMPCEMPPEMPYIPETPRCV